MTNGSELAESAGSENTVFKSIEAEASAILGIFYEQLLAVTGSEFCGVMKERLRRVMPACTVFTGR